MICFKVNGDNFGNITKTELSDNNQTRTTSFQYDSKGRFVTQSTDVAGLITEYNYDPRILWYFLRLGY